MQLEDRAKEIIETVCLWAIGADWRDRTCQKDVSLIDHYVMSHLSQSVREGAKQEKERLRELCDKLTNGKGLPTTSNADWPSSPQ